MDTPVMSFLSFLSGYYYILTYLQRPHKPEPTLNRLLKSRRSHTLLLTLWNETQMIQHPVSARFGFGPSPI
uniref:Uncharacterized protein n=1 Tax=Anguilla anguilla TaxID=7936 RepID=A0A0E9RN40_ANGAN